MAYNAHDFTGKDKMETGYTAEYVKESFKGGYLKDNIFYWKSNDHFPFSDMTADFVTLGLMTQEQKDKTDKARDKDDEEFWKTHSIKIVREDQIH